MVPIWWGKKATTQWPQTRQQRRNKRGMSVAVRKVPKRCMSLGHVCFFLLFIRFYITVLTSFLDTFSDNCHLFRRCRPQHNGHKHDDDRGTSGAARKVPKRCHTMSLGHLVCFFFFYFHITNYFLDTMLVFWHPTPVSSTTGIIHRNNGEQRGNERGYEENTQETSYNVFLGM